jgi:aerobic C4-dicarboxylate transport protein
VHLSLAQTLSILGVLLLTSKGAAAVSGGGFITLAATLSTIHSIPIAGLALLLGVDRFMADARALTNLVGNAVATVVIAQWDGALDMARAQSVLNRQVTESGDDEPTAKIAEPEQVLVAATYAR